jgi:hypothetical protein
MTYYLSNAFSLQMLSGRSTLSVEDYSVEQVRKLLGGSFHSIVGHQDTARLFSNILGVDVHHNRESVVLKASDILIVGQIIGGRLPEGTTELPAGVEIRWVVVSIVSIPSE